MDDVLYDPPDVAVALCEVEVAQTGRGFIVMGVRLELDITIVMLVLPFFEWINRNHVRWRASASVP